MTNPTSPSRVSPIFVLSLLYVGYLLSFGDRIIFSLVIRYIKATFHFSDSQLGLLAGAAFALSYALFSPLAGWAVDRFRRTPLFAGAVGFWSVATLATGLAGSLLTFGLARVGVGAGEAVLNPLAVSLIADTNPPERRPRNFSIYLSAGAVGTVMAMLLGGLLIKKMVKAGGAHFPLIGAVAPWQALFIWASLPGFVLMVIVALFLREAPRTSIAGEGNAAEPGKALGFLRQYPLMSLAIFCGVSLIQMGAYTATTWNVVFFERIHGWKPGESGVTLGLTAGLGTVIGCLAIGPLLGWLRKRGVVDAPFRVCIAAGVWFCLCATACYLSPTPKLATVFLALGSLAGYAPSVCAFSMLGEGVPVDIRARLAGLHTLANGIISNSLGPFLVGLFDDKLFPGPTGIRMSLVTIIAIAGVGGVILVALGRGEYTRRVATRA